MPVSAVRVFVALAIMSSALAHAAPSKIVVHLDVPESSAPEFVCAVTAWSCAKGKCTNSDRLPDAARRYWPSRDPASLADFAVQSAAPGTTPLAGLVEAAFSQMASPPRDTCSDRHDGCQATVHVPRGIGEDFVNQWVTCGHGDSNDGRVAVLYLFSDQRSQPAVITSLEVLGNVATLGLELPLTGSDVVQAEVIGGDYLPSARTAVGSRERMEVTLIPRCRPVTVVAPVSDQSLFSPATVEMSVGGRQGSCRASNLSSFVVPAANVLGRRVVSVSIEKANGTRVALEGSWLDRDPPDPLELGYRTIDFDWKREPLAGVWKEPKQHWNWNGSCPRAVIGPTVCRLRSGTEESQQRAGICPYRCEVKGEALKLPVEVRFERVRTRDDSPIELYTWTDILRKPGQVLFGFVAAADRKLIVEFENPDMWAPLGGDQYDAIRIVSNGKGTDIELSPVRGYSKPPKWTVVPAPGIAGPADRVRVAVFGTRVYNESSPRVGTGQLWIEDPANYRQRNHLWLLVGGGALEPLNETQRSVGLPHRGEKYVSLGLDFQIYLNDSRGSLDIDFSGQLSDTAYGGLSPNFSTRPDLGRVLYQRNNLRFTREWWLTRAFHLGVGTGVSWGFPMAYQDRDIVGGFRTSMLNEINGRYALSWRGGALVEGVLGLRSFERHYFFTTDFVGEPSGEERRLVQPYLEVRLRLRFH